MSHIMENTEPDVTNEDLPNLDKNGIMEKNFSKSKGIYIHNSPSKEEHETDADKGGEESKKVPLPGADSPVNEENESEIPNFENRPMLVQLPESLTDPVNELKSQVGHTKKETHLEISKIHPLVDDKELSTSEVHSSDSNSEDATSHDINHRGSQAKLPKKEGQAIQNANKVNVTELKEAPKRFPKNLSYHGTGRLPCPSLGDGWTIEQIVRQQGKSAGRYDTYYYSPSGAKIRSKLKLREFVDVDLTSFDYNSGKFIESGQVVISPKPKMSLLKTKELKTIDRSTENNSNSPSSKQAKKLLIKLPPRKKLFRGMCSSTTDRKKLTKKARKRKLPSSSMTRNVVRIDDDSSQNNPFEVFKTKASSLSSHFEDMKDYDDLIQFAWNFLSIESKTRFNEIFAAKSSIEPRTASRVEKLSCHSELPGESQKKCSRLDSTSDSSHSTSIVIEENNISTAASSDMNVRSHDSTSACSSSHQFLHANQERSTPSDNEVASASHFCASPGDFKLTQKPHKRKSRVPVYIKQHSNGNAV